MRCKGEKSVIDQDKNDTVFVVGGLLLCIISILREQVITVP